MIRKLLASMLACAMVVCLLPALFLPITTAGGETLISDSAGLQGITSDGDYRLTADIDLLGVEWSPLASFSGTLDGDGHVISNLSITDTSAASGNNKGLFAVIADGGVVFDLGIERANITAGDNVGCIAGTNSGRISGCYVTGTVSGNNYVGGIAGVNGATGVIENCYSHASVSGKNYLGGLAGSNSGEVTTSYAASSVTDSVMNNYLVFNSTGDFLGNEAAGGYVNIPHINQYNADAFTLEAWFQWDAVGSDAVNFIFGKNYEWFEIHTGGGSGVNGIRFIPIPNGGDGGYSGDSWIDVRNVLQAGWVHVAAVYSYDSAEHEANVQVYVNGEAQDLWQTLTAGGSSVNVGKSASIARTSNPLANSTTNNADINIGRRTNVSYLFHGKIADVRFWNTIRTGEQIRADKDRVLTGTERGLVGYWKLNESAPENALNAIDSSVNENDGVLSGDVVRVTTPGTAAYKGALVGDNTGTVTKSYFDSALYGSEYGVGAAKSTAEMQSETTYSDWDFTATWMITAGGYPSLQANITVSAVTVAPATGIVWRGSTQRFSASVIGRNNPEQAVNWSVSGNSSALTFISADGVLTVGGDETATSLTVKATAVADSSKNVTATMTVATAAQYSIIEGADGEWEPDGSSGLGFTADADIDRFVGVLVDGVEVSSDDYTSETGSTIVTLSPDYLETLSVGWHTLRVSFTDGYAQTRFTVAASVPLTGDGANLLLWLGVAFGAAALWAIFRVPARKKR